jgi:hypothetical protein
MPVPSCRPRSAPTAEPRTTRPRSLGPSIRGRSIGRIHCQAPARSARGPPDLRAPADAAPLHRTTPVHRPSRHPSRKAPAPAMNRGLRAVGAPPLPKVIMSDLTPYPAPALPLQAAAGGGPGCIDTTVAHPARRYNYWLGGKDHFAADRASGDAIAEAFPGVRIAAFANRRFLHRVVRYLAAEAGIRQFLDIGVGLPLPPNTHELAQDIAPDCRIVYVDNDPLVLTHARALLTSSPQGKTGYLDADLRDPASIVNHPDLRQILDLDQPVGLLLVAVLHFLTDDEAARAVAVLRGALAPGSYVVLSHGTDDYLTSGDSAQIPALTKADPVRFRPRSRAAIAGYVAGLHLVDPDPTPDGPRRRVVVDGTGRGLVSVARWRVNGDSPRCGSDKEVACYGVAARVPDRDDAPTDTAGTGTGTGTGNTDGGGPGPRQHAASSAIAAGGGRR